MITLRKVEIKQDADESPDTSDLGEYTNSRSDWAICRACGEYAALHAEDSDCVKPSREYAYFVPYAGGEEAGTPDYQKYGKQDYARMESLGNDWYFMGVYAVAKIVVDGITQTIKSGGLWGIESDSEKEYIEEEEENQLAELKGQLEAMGVDMSNWEELSKEAIAR